MEAVPLGRLLTAMRPYFDFILLDTAAGMGAPFTAASTVADKALLVLTPDPVALRDGKIVADRAAGGWPPAERRAPGDEPRPARELRQKRCRG